MAYSKTARRSSSEARSELSIGVEALIDIKEIFRARGATKLGSEFICEELHKLEHRRWPEYGRSRRPITRVQLANLFRRYHISPGSVRPDLDGVTIGENTVKGYKFADFDSAFSSYLPPGSGTTAQVNETAADSQNRGGTSDLLVPFRDERKPVHSLGCAVVPPSEGGLGGIKAPLPPRMNPRKRNRAAGVLKFERDGSDSAGAGERDSPRRFRAEPHIGRGP